jgi:hypothetical protein
MEMLAGRWATAEPTAAAMVRVLRNMLAMIFKGQCSMNELYFLWVRGEVQLNVGASR